MTNNKELKRKRAPQQTPKKKRKRNLAYGLELQNGS